MKFKANIAAFKKGLFNIIDPQGSGKASKAFDIAIIALIVLTVVLVIIDSFDALDDFYFGANIIEWIIVIIFTIEYIFRIWTADLLYPDKTKAKARLKYIFSFMAIIDLIAILPFYLPFIFPRDIVVIRALRVVRVLRLFKFSRYTNVLQTLGAVLRRKAAQLASSVLLIFILMVITAVLMYNVEHAAQPDKFSNAFDALWWTISTMTTIGYGDIYPITTAGQILSGIIAFLGIGMIAIPTGILSAGFIEQAKTENKKQDKNFCAHCGQKLEGEK